MYYSTSGSSINFETSLAAQPEVVKDGGMDGKGRQQFFPGKRGCWDRVNLVISGSYVGVRRGVCVFLPVALRRRKT